MECGLSVRRIPYLLALLLLIPAVGAGGTRTLVLVCQKESRLSPLTAEDARKAFLGAPVLVSGRRLEAIRNRSDALLDEVFLQKVVFLSGPAYERQVLSRVFRLGGQKPVVYDALPDLLTALRGSPDRVTYMWSDSLLEHPDLRTLATLWTGAVE
jgi:hypothetical protein